MNKKEGEVMPGLTVTSVDEHSDGTATINFDITDEFKEYFKEITGLKRWSDKRFKKVMFEAVENFIEEELKNNEET